MTQVQDVQRAEEHAEINSHRVWRTGECYEHRHPPFTQDPGDSRVSPHGRPHPLCRRDLRLRRLSTDSTDPMTPTRPPMDRISVKRLPALFLGTTTGTTTVLSSDPVGSS